ncbi:hypothetical protein HPHPH41_0094 [Helicobacter pylori Hp H-41]|nr:hypothetical protein HPHPH41_0094 [Helicobacter pylori Hp H-41]
MGKMIAKPFYLLKSISLRKSFLQQNLQTNLKKNPFYNKSQAIKSHFLEEILLTTTPNNQS